MEVLRGASGFLFSKIHLKEENSYPSKYPRITIARIDFRNKKATHYVAFFIECTRRHRNIEPIP